MNAAGSLGFSPIPDAPFTPDIFGAFVTNPISFKPRKPAQNRHLTAYPGGAILHTGLPNPGLKAVIQNHASRWARLPVPVIVHLLPAEPEEVSRMVKQLEELENVLAVEIRFGDQVARETAQAIIRAALGELPVIGRVPLPRAYDLAPAVIEAGANAVSLGAAQGSLPGANDGVVSGRLFGSGVFPLALEAVQMLAAQSIPVIGAGGIYAMDQAQAMLRAGALAVQIDVALWGNVETLES